MKEFWKLFGPFCALYLWAAAMGLLIGYGLWGAQ